MNDRDSVCYELLMKVFRDNAYASIELNAALPGCAESDRPYITMLFYGVLERSVYYDYVLSKFAKDKPKKPIAVIIKMGYYLLEKTSTPSYAAVNNMVALCKRVGKSGASGFVNSALRKFGAVDLPKEGTDEYLSVKYSYPIWLVKRLVRDYGYDFVREELAYSPERRVHIRVNTACISESEFESKYGARVESSGFGYYASHTALASIDPHHYVVQSAASVIAARAYVAGLERVDNALDLCAAPGGKAALVAAYTGAKVTACDLHPHRAEFIRKYAENCKLEIEVAVNDATVFRPEWKNKFDLVVCDVPCSGIGVVGSKPDILYNRSEKDIDELNAVQRAILATAAAYVRVGGRLCYSTCTVIKEENADTVNDFLAKHGEFKAEKIPSPIDGKPQAEIELFGHVNRTDGFYVAVLKKITE